MQHREKHLKDFDGLKIGLVVEEDLTKIHLLEKSSKKFELKVKNLMIFFTFSFKSTTSPSSPITAVT